MRTIFLIAALIANFVLFQWVFDGEALWKLEATILFVVVSTLLVTGAHAISRSLRHDRAGQRLEFFGFFAAIIGVVATGAVSQGPEAAEAYEQARDRVINEQQFIRDLVNEVYDPNCEGWSSRARPVRRTLAKEIPDFRSPEFRAELQQRLSALDYSCLLLWDARSVRQEGEFSEAIARLEEVSEIGELTVPEDLIQDLKNWASDPFVLQLKAEELRSRSEWIEVAGEFFDPLSKFLVLMALSIGAGRTAFFAFLGRRADN